MEKKPKCAGELIPSIVCLSYIERRIYLIRKQKVRLNSDLDELCGVETFNLNKAVKRNIDRFPGGFMFQLFQEEAESLRFQIALSDELDFRARINLSYAAVVKLDNTYSSCKVETANSR
jgi:hypothetical protein